MTLAERTGSVAGTPKASTIAPRATIPSAIPSSIPPLYRVEAVDSKPSLPSVEFGRNAKGEASWTLKAYALESSPGTTLEETAERLFLLDDRIRARERGLKAPKEADGG